jgi:hypothetical protein
MSASKVKKRKLEDKGRVFQEKWENMYFFSVVRDKIVCLICSKVVSAPKEYNLRRHYETLHKDKFGVLEGRLRENKLKNLKCDLQRQQNIFTVGTKTNEAAVQASFIISQIIAKKSKPFTDGEYMKECVMKAAEILCPKKQQLFKNISLSAKTVAKCVNDLAGDIQCQLKEKCKNFVAYSIAIDESTDVKDIAQLVVFVRGVNEDFELVEELLELVPMKGKTVADEIFSQLVTLLNEFQLPWEKMVGFVSDGAPATIGKK